MMTSWEGGFGWQDYALTGRPDFLNYLHSGDVSWEELWEFYRQHPASPEAIRALMRLFHMFLSSAYDAAGCWLDPEGEISSRLRGWAEFMLDSADRLPLGEVQTDLANLFSTGLATPLYYLAVYQVWMETTVDRLAAGWPTSRSDEPNFDCPDLPKPGDRHLPVYHPGPERFPHLLGDATWESALRSQIAREYRSWNLAYAAHLPDFEEEEAWMTVGGEG
jgi:hypothetical protein